MKYCKANDNFPNFFRGSNVGEGLREECLQDVGCRKDCEGKFENYEASLCKILRNIPASKVRFQKVVSIRLRFKGRSRMRV